MRVRLHGLSSVTVENSDANLQVAIHRAIDRSGWTVARQIIRQHRLAMMSLLSEPLPADNREPDRAA